MTQSKARPIVLRAFEVRGLRDGSISQLRRVIKPQPYIDSMGNACWKGGCFGQDGLGNPLFPTLASPVPSSKTKRVLCPFGAPGGLLYGKEAWRFPSSLDALSPAAVGDKALDAGYRTPWAPIQYEADNARTSTWSAFHSPPTDTVPGRCRHGRFMPRWAARIHLRLSQVRVERLQEISEADAIAGGCQAPEDDDASNVPECPQCNGLGLYTAFNPGTGGALPDTDCRVCDTPVKRYRLLWDRTHGPGSWDANPFVWCLDVVRVEGGAA